MMTTFRHRFPVGLLVVLLYVSAAGAEQTSQQAAPPHQSQPQNRSTAPIPAYHSPLAVVAQGGYNHQFSRADRIAALYRFNEYSYSGLSKKIYDNTVQLFYARRVTGRLAFQVGAGPEYTLFNNPILTGSGGRTSLSQLTWSFKTSLNYWFAGANLDHPLGRTINLFLSYQAQYQDSNSSFCVGASCNTSLGRHLISAGFNWQARPMVF